MREAEKIHPGLGRQEMLILNPNGVSVSTNIGIRVAIASAVGLFQRKFQQNGLGSRGCRNAWFAIYTSSS